MANNNPSQIFDIDLEELEAVRDIFGATEKEMRLAYNRALKRTAKTIASMSAKLMRDELKAKKLKSIRKRLKHFQSKKSNSLDTLKFWFGLNPIPAHLLRGRFKKLTEGASFTPAASNLKSVTDRRGFIMQKEGNKLMFIRTSKREYESAKVDINDSLQIKIEDEIFEQVPEIFMKHYETDLKGRVRMRNKSS